MRFHRFELEHFLAAHEHSARHVLGTSGIATVAPSELAMPAVADPFDYGVMPGEPKLVRAVAHARGVPEDHVLLTIGGTEALFLVPLATVDHGDRVIVESPTYFPIHEVPRLLGARVQTVPRTFEEDWRLDVDDIIRLLDDDVALVSVTSPNNPTGRATPARDLARLAEACDEVGAWLLVDEIFRGLAQPRPPVSHALHPRIITTDSLTKCYGLSGLRVGWILATPDMRDTLREAKALTSAVNAAWTQALAIEALRHEERLLSRALQITQTNLGRWRAFAREHKELAWREPDAPLLTLVRLPDGTDDVKFCERLVADESVLLVPGSHLGAPGFVRLGFGARPETFEKGLAALGRFLAKRA